MTTRTMTMTGFLKTPRMKFIVFSSLMLPASPLMMRIGSVPSSIAKGMEALSKAFRSSHVLPEKPMFTWSSSTISISACKNLLPVGPARRALPAVPPAARGAPRPSAMGLAGSYTPLANVDICDPDPLSTRSTFNEIYFQRDLLPARSTFNEG